MIKAKWGSIWEFYVVMNRVFEGTQPQTNFIPGLLTVFFICSIFRESYPHAAETYLNGVDTAFEPKCASLESGHMFWLHLN